jgi:dATP pyrophosphohydrolase
MKLRHDLVTCYVARPDAQGNLRELLQLRRAPGEYLAGAWAPVRGRIEAGETASQAALRELQEETGLTPAEFFALNTIDLFYLAHDDGVWHVPGFVAVVPGGASVTLNEEHDAARWVDRSRIDAEFLWPGERAQLAEACREILDDGPAKAYLRLAVAAP